MALPLLSHFSSSPLSAHFSPSINSQKKLLVNEDGEVEKRGEKEIMQVNDAQISFQLNLDELLQIQHEKKSDFNLFWIIF